MPSMAWWTPSPEVEMRVPAVTADASAPEPPSTYSWHLYVRRDTHEALELFFFYGDPDVGNTYVMTRAGAL
jgi:hypothetical protein